ncbi:GEVED domain-containing protein [Pontibacter pamirensis]|uniref:GEVED domain-containing protein n=1 Tax=Pontibacter pamirensis TaxID=2562824 RepID=UPI00138A154F|nr:GEVED domain-containing protein [Pontibacter pamirensis]
MEEIVIQKCTSNNIVIFCYRKHRVYLTQLLLTFLSFTATGETKVWDSTYGGIISTFPEENIYTGNSGGKSEATKGFSDYWVVKVKDETNPYCIPSMASGCAGDNFIGYFRFAGIYYSAVGQGCQNDNSYTKFYPFYDITRDSNYSATVKQGQSYPVTLRSYSQYGEVAQAQAYGVWIDYNDDKDFDDPGEYVYSSPEVGAEFTGTITIPADAVSGVRRLRVRSRPDGVFIASESCTTGNYGETQDYTIAIGYCAPYAPNGCGNGSYIDNFSFNTLVNNNSGCSGEGGYIYYEPTGTLTTNVQKGESYSISVQSGPVAQAFGVWLDYNNDRDFDDEGELVYASPIIGKNYVEAGGVVYSPSVSTDPFNGTVTIPASANTGPVRMRVRSNSFPFRGAEACATYDPDFPGLFSDSLLFGEIEDYTITIEDAVLPPEFTSFSPNKGLPGTMVTLGGANLLATSSVSFNGAEADFEVISDTELQAFVPADASTGRITITTTGGEVTSGREFKVLQPSIHVLAPRRGYVGSKVNIVGEHLATASEVLFNGVPATDLTVRNDRLLRVTVPEGATTGRVTVKLAGGGQAVSSFSYTVIQPTNKAKKKAVVLTTTETEQIITYPNPFAEGVTISLNLQKEESVSLEIYSSSGQKVRELNFERLGAGQQELVWDGADSYGKPVSRGLYLYKLAANGKIASGKLLKER